MAGPGLLLELKVWVLFRGPRFLQSSRWDLLFAVDTKREDGRQ